MPNFRSVVQARASRAWVVLVVWAGPVRRPSANSRRDGCTSFLSSPLSPSSQDFFYPLLALLLGIWIPGKGRIKDFMHFSFLYAHGGHGRSRVGNNSHALAPLFSFSIVFFRSAILPRSPRGSKLRKSGQKCPFGSAREYREAFRFEPVSKNRSFFGRSGREEPNTKDWTTVVLQHISRSLFEPLMLSNSNETSQIFECERRI